MGYNKQTEILTNYNIIDNPKWITLTKDNPNEIDGGGDTLYVSDYKLIRNVLGTTKALNDNKESSYGLTSKYYQYEEGIIVLIEE